MICDLLNAKAHVQNEGEASAKSCGKYCRGRNLQWKLRELGQIILAATIPLRRRALTVLGCNADTVTRALDVGDIWHFVPGAVAVGCLYELWSSNIGFLGPLGSILESFPHFAGDNGEAVGE